MMKMREAIALLKQAPERLEQAAFKAIRDTLTEAREIARTRYIVDGDKDAFEDPPNPEPGPLKSRSGALRRTIKLTKIEKRGNEWVGGLQAGSGSVPYARILGKGGVTRAHEIWPVRAAALAWRARGDVFNRDGDQVGAEGDTIFAKHVNHPGSNIPARPYLEPAIRDANFGKKFSERIRQAVKGLLRRG